MLRKLDNFLSSWIEKAELHAPLGICYQVSIQKEREWKVSVGPHAIKGLWHHETGDCHQWEKWKAID